MASERISLTVPGPDGDREISLSSPNRVIWPALGITKHELAEYVIAVSEPFLRANGHRPVSLERFAETVDGERFFSKNPPRGAPDYVHEVMCTYNSGRRHPQVVLDEAAAIVWAVQMNTVVFHPWASLAADTDNPVELRIDLDPQPGTGFADAAAVAPALREVLREAGLDAWIKTSGNRGIHVFCPIEPMHEFLDVRHAVIAAGRELERRMPDRVTMNWWKEERGERIFVDFNQANRDRTMAGAYSPRALPTAAVAAPITWDELASGVDPAAFTVRSMPERLAERGDPWEGLQAAPGRIDTLLEWWQRDVDAGLGELPFPPEFPKMPGEPPRVQPSRAKKAEE
ncbi:MAG: ATP-dependent DNA ligase [Microbacterium sp. SCN 70-200]|uniref:DNA polymerase domain-containing protein n=1 Tax=unclassified Microbacterium TaxID=2609290 RepID=UPI00086AB7A3|nr:MULTISPECIES: ATP-dependent DNA ligase [unclassified Microbacterium]MBN9215771.1 ATP-dependent DNA ligase [Microbacterium sp.]ODT39947.1 MAG: ATP-dependent DNA ligase [Microbacterium sp. SCN 70-200]OJV81971.1 MAG: ATP-dependent DNA ligase [Microbacterium sp. 70-16]